ncbi:septal ring lytic transglycosylase RlpA family protein [Massilia cavernae]|uniref:Endolytic peptidoglycan transglycosylase RlpA n=1 Tax=Massilia cavernae TaxID=2320864 RepID=A0A418XSB7_9BURK|nr:septal ring lytic transglycosylase RlpA family protein [Massilia cavernae]RJG15439.1 septal ring lytic transglycosylase RlpA family protein [Massilia cavernae]
MAARKAPALLALAVLVAGCGSTGDKAVSIWPFPKPAHKGASHPKVDPDLPRLPPAGSGRGGYYKDDGPGDNPPPNLKDVADAVVRAEPYSKWANRPYKVLGKTYVPITNEEPFVQRGVSTWYGKKFHGQRTSSGELYDMYKMTAAHPTLPIPSYARVTSVESGKSVVVRINDRGPFHASRVIDVSFTAALKLGLLGKGSHEVQVERLFPNRGINIAEQRRNAPQEPSKENAPTEIAALVLEGSTLSDSEALGTETRPQAAAAGFWLQLGSYASAGKAGQARRRMLDAGDAGANLEVAAAGKLHRLYSGPFATRKEADKAARGLRRAGLKPIVVRR